MIDEQDIRDAVAASTSLMHAAQRLGTSRTTLTRCVRELGDVDLSHMIGRRGRPRTDDMIFVKGLKRESVIRQRFLQLGRVLYTCAVCDLAPVWNDQPLTLQLDHINGQSTDNRVENLRWICPNCHSQTETYVGKNSKGTRKTRVEV